MDSKLAGRPHTTRSRIVLEIAAELVADPGWPYHQARISLRTQGATDRAVALFGSDGPVTSLLKCYKGERVLQVEIIVNKTEELRCGKRLEKLPGMLERLQETAVAFLAVVQAAHLSFVDGQQLDALAAPGVQGARRTAGVDLQKPRMRAIAQAVIALAAQPGASVPQIWPSECTLQTLKIAA